MFLILPLVLAGILLALPSQKDSRTNLQPVRQVDVPCEEPRRQPRKETPQPGDIANNYLKLWHFRSVIVTDGHGNSESPRYESVHVYGIPGPGVEDVVYDKGGEFSVMITTRATETFTFTFQPLDGEGGDIDLVRGFGNAYPDMAMRYNDLLLPRGATGMLKVTPGGFEPLRVDKDGDGKFEAEIKPDAYVTGSAANDTQGPTLCFGKSGQGGKTLVTITAVDESGVKAVYYSLDPPPAWHELRPSGPGVILMFRPYTGPFEVDPARNRVVLACADDKLGNRGIDEYKIRSSR